MTGAGKSKSPPAPAVRAHRWGPTWRVWMRAPERVDTFELSMSATPEPDESRIREERSGIFVVIHPERVCLFGRTVRDGQRSEWVKAERIRTDR